MMYIMTVFCILKTIKYQKCRKRIVYNVSFAMKELFSPRCFNSNKTWPRRKRSLLAVLQAVFSSFQCCRLLDDTACTACQCLFPLSSKQDHLINTYHHVNGTLEVEESSYISCKSVGVQLEPTWKYVIAFDISGMIQVNTIKYLP